MMSRHLSGVKRLIVEFFVFVFFCGKVPTSRSPRPWDLVSALPLCDFGLFRSLSVSIEAVVAMMLSTMNKSI